MIMVEMDYILPPLMQTYGEFDILHDIVYDNYIKTMVNGWSIC